MSLFKTIAAVAVVGAAATAGYVYREEIKDYLGMNGGTGGGTGNGQGNNNASAQPAGDSK